MIAHSAFIIVSRRLVPNTANPPEAFTTNNSDANGIDAESEEPAE
jgi:hypothetical protein